MSGDPLSVLVGDIDDFKDFNDRFGHLEGDGVLRAIAQALAGAVRRPDVAYRWGGDESVVWRQEIVGVARPTEQEKRDGYRIFEMNTVPTV